VIIKILIMNDETFLSNDGKKFGGDALSYHMLFSHGARSFLSRVGLIRRSPDATATANAISVSGDTRDARIFL
jgi:hypothetical protein